MVEPSIVWVPVVSASIAPANAAEFESRTDPVTVRSPDEGPAQRIAPPFSSSASPPVSTEP